MTYPSEWAVALACLLAAGSAAAQTQRGFSHRDTFFAITGGFDATGPLDDCSGQVCGPVTFSNMATIAEFTDLLPGLDVSVGGPETFLLTFDEPVYGFGIDVVEPTDSGPPPGCDNTCEQSTIRVTLRLGSDQVGQTMDFEPRDNIPTFIGVAIDQPFDRVDVQEIVGGHENEYFGHVYAATEPFVSDIQVNANTAGPQLRPAATFLTDELFVVVWNGTEQVIDNIRARRFGHPPGDTGVGAEEHLPIGPVGFEFQVNSYTSGLQFDASVAAGPSGEFVVLWSSEGSSGSDNSGRSIQARRYASDGTPTGGEFQVNAFTPLEQQVPAGAIASEGQLLAVWQSEASGGSDTDTFSIQAQRFDDGNAPQGLHFQVNTYTSGIQRSPDAAFTMHGDFVVVWRSDGSGGLDNDEGSIQGQRFDTTGSPIGAQFQVNTYTTGPQLDPAVAAHPAGGFLVVWTDTTHVSARRFGDDGMPIGDEFVVDEYPLVDSPDVAVGKGGEYIVAWTGFVSPDTDTGFSVQARRLAANGAPLGGQFQVNSYTDETQYHPAVASGSGRHLVVWGGDSFGPDVDDSIQAFHLGAPTPIFADGFESGDTAAWSVTNP